MGKGIMMGNQPFPDDHPFKGGAIIFGAKRPGSSVKPSTQKEETSSTKPDLSPFELEARESYESAMLDRFEQATGNKRPTETLSSESTIPENPESPSPETSTEQE